MARKGGATDKQVRKIEGRLRARLGAMFPRVDIHDLVLDLRPLIHEIARDGIDDHDALFRRAATEPKFRELVARIGAGIAARTGA